MLAAKAFGGVKLPSLPRNVAPGLLRSVVVDAQGDAYGSSTYVQPSTNKATRVRIKTKPECELAIGYYPKFRYNAVGGGGWGSVEDLGQGVLKLAFDTQVLVIPDLSYRTGSIFGVPLPPGLNIGIKPLRLEGTLDVNTGEARLEFDADFYFTAGPFYTAPPLIVRTVLTTESTEGAKGIQRGTGKRFVNNAGTLVGTATIDRVDDMFMDNFLQLPTDVLAVMAAEFEWQ